MKVLVIAAHPDDEVLGCGSTVARLASEGATVSILILANGLTSRSDFEGARARELLGLHHDRAKRAGLILGAKEVSIAGFPDQKMDAVPLLEVVHAVEREVARVRPHTIFTHHGGDLNMDHVVTFRAVMTAVRPIKGSFCKRLLTFEVPSSTEWSFAQFEPAFRPNVFFEAGAFFEKKLKGMATYESEVRVYPHPRSPEALDAVARSRGSQVGVERAEAFQLIWEIL